MVSHRTNGPLNLRRLGVALRKTRTRAGITQASVAKQLRCSQDTVSNIERGQKEPSDAQVRRVLDVCNAEPELREEVLALLREVQAAEAAWWDGFHDVFTPKFLSFFAYEDTAKAVRSYSGGLIPGILQTEAYARALAEFYFADQSREYRERFVKARMARRGVVDRAETAISWLVQETAFLSEVGGRRLLQEQAASIVETVEGRPDLSIRVIPVTSPMASLAGSSFTIMDYAAEEDPSLLFWDTPLHGVFSQDGPAVETERRRLDTIRAACLSDEESIQLIKKAARQ